MSCCLKICWLTLTKRKSSSLLCSTGVVLFCMLLVLSDRSPRCFAADTENKDLQVSEESAGQQDLDAAIEQKLSAQSLDDFERVIDLCRRAIRKGLPEDSRDCANNRIVGTLIDRAVMQYLMRLARPLTGQECVPLRCVISEN